jgi:hypothetical protein
VRLTIYRIGAAFAWLAAPSAPDADNPAHTDCGLCTSCIAIPWRSSSFRSTSGITAFSDRIFTVRSGLPRKVEENSNDVLVNPAESLREIARMDIDTVPLQVIIDSGSLLFAVLRLTI